MLCQVWEVLLQVSGWLAVQAVNGMLGLDSVPESRDADVGRRVKRGQGKGR